MPKVKYEVLSEAFEEISVKLYKDSIAAKIHKERSKEDRKIELTALFNDHMEELRSLDVNDDRARLLVQKINKLLDNFSELLNNKKLKVQINDAYKKRIKSKIQSKVTLNSATVERLNAVFAVNGIKGSFDYSINTLLTALGVNELTSAVNRLENEVSESVKSHASSSTSQKLDVDELGLSSKDKVKRIKKQKRRKNKKEKVRL